MMKTHNSKCWESWGPNPKQDISTTLSKTQEASQKRKKWRMGRFLSVFSCTVIKYPDRSHLGAGEIAQCIKTPATTPDYECITPVAHMAAGENHLQEVTLWPPHIHGWLHSPTHIYRVDQIHMLWSSLRERRATCTHSVCEQSIMAGNPRRQEAEVTGSTTSTLRNRKLWMPVTSWLSSLMLLTGNRSDKQEHFTIL